MTFCWRTEPDSALPPSLQPEFSSQADAEAWLGAHFAELADAGATAVSLYCGSDLVYGPMSLAE